MEYKAEFIKESAARALWGFRFRTADTYWDPIRRIFPHAVWYGTWMKIVCMYGRRREEKKKGFSFSQMRGEVSCMHACTQDIEYSHYSPVSVHWSIQFSCRGEVTSKDMNEPLPSISMGYNCTRIPRDKVRRPKPEPNAVPTQSFLCLSAWSCQFRMAPTSNQLVSTLALPPKRQGCVELMRGKISNVLYPDGEICNLQNLGPCTFTCTSASPLAKGRV